MPRVVPKSRSRGSSVGIYQSKFKVGDEVLYDGVEYFVETADNRTNEFIPLRRRCRPYSRPCTMAPIKKLKKNNFIARKSLQKNMWVLFDIDGKTCILSVILERIGDDLTIQPLNIRKNYSVSIYSNRIDLAIDVDTPDYTIRTPVLSNPYLEALITVGHKGAKIIDYDVETDLYLALDNTDRLFTWVEESGFVMDYGDSDPFDCKWENTGTLTIPYDDLVLSDSGISYKKIQMDTVDIEAVKIDLWARICHHNINRYGSVYKTDIHILYIVLWLENHHAYWRYQDTIDGYEIRDVDHYLIEALLSRSEVDMEMIGQINKRRNISDHDRHRAIQIEKKLRSKPMFKTEMRYQDGNIIVDIMHPSTAESRMRRMAHKALTCTLICKVLWHMTDRPSAMSWSHSKMLNYTMQNNFMPVRLKHPLKPFQEKIVYDMRQRELSTKDILAINTKAGATFNAVSGFDWTYPLKGGILALDTGMGKTVCTLALIQQSLQIYKIKPTLIVVPLTLIDQWIYELKKFTDLSYGEIHGRKTIDKCTGKDVVFTTYGTLLSAHKQDLSSAIFTMFKRVVFDESHQHKSHMSSTVQACYGINASYRWCLSATPMMNNTIQNLHAQMKMLCVRPFEAERHYLKEIMEVEESRSKWIVEKITNTIIRPDLSKCIHIPPPKIYENEITFDKNTHTVYERLVRSIRNKISEIWSNGGVFSEFQRVKSLINNICIASVDPTLIPIHMLGKRIQGDEFSTTTIHALNDSLGGNKFEEEVKKVVNSLDEATCSLCLETISRPTLTNCLHIYCHDCIKKSLEFRKKCPMCRTNLDERKFKEIKASEEEEKIPGFVIKTDLLGRRVMIEEEVANMYEKMTRSKLEELKKIISKRKKVVVYSQYNTILESFAKEIPSSIITGRSSRTQRKTNIDNFKEGATDVFFLSTKIADVGINLTEGDTLVFLEPGIDSDVEKQAFGRLKRIGQEKTVHVYKLYSTNSIEDNIREEKPLYEHAVSGVMCSGGSKSYISKKKKQFYLRYITNILKLN